MTHKIINDYTRAAGCGYQGTIKISYAELVAKLGQPMGPSGDGKVQAEWILETPHGNGQIITIYDYKEYDTPVEKVREWHIGGRSKTVVAIAHGILGKEQQ